MSEQDSDRTPIVDDGADADEEQGGPIREYDIVSSPNDFNIRSLVSFVDRGLFTIPGFQRNYVWDIGRASRLIESVLLGLPVPQVFLYETEKNRFMVIDGQQRIMSLFYFTKKRFPRKEIRPKLRRLIDENRGRIPDDLLEDDTYFQRFNLYLPSKLPEDRSPFHGLNYSTLGDAADTYDFRTIRSISIKQLSPNGDDSVFEMFNRLNSGGINLRPQEMRACIYHSAFFERVHRLNSMGEWRKVLGVAHPDVRMKDSEVILRALAMLKSGDAYKPSMARFLNQFSKESAKASASELDVLESVAEAFIREAAQVGPELFHLQSTKLSVPLFEAVFRAVCRPAYEAKDPSLVGKIPEALVAQLKRKPEFVRSISSNSADTANVKLRLRLAQEAL